MSEKEFLNFLKTASDEMRKRNMVGKDILFRKIFLNATINRKNEVVFLCKPEFNGLIKSELIALGWSGGIRTPEWWDQNPLPYHLANPQGVLIVAQSLSKI